MKIEAEFISENGVHPLMILDIDGRKIGYVFNPDTLEFHRVCSCNACSAAIEIQMVTTRKEKLT